MKDAGMFFFSMEKVTLRDDKGKEIKNIRAVSNFNDKWYIATDKGLYTNNAKLVQQSNFKKEKI